jgi:pyridoxamine 5'-phosphate oxidase
MNAPQEYTASALLESDLDADPIKHFAKWFQDAQNGDVREPEAMTLSTVSADGKPSARMVLLRGFDDRGFCFYTHYLSKKGRDLERTIRFLRRSRASLP